MKNLSFIITAFAIGLCLYGKSYACGQHLNIKTDSNGYIYFQLPTFQPFIETKNGITYATIRPITCEFSTKYEKTINFYINDDGGNIENKSISSSNPLKRVFSGFFPYANNKSMSVQLYNYGCNANIDGDDCIEAKQQKLDNLIVNCN